jgi:hypothetical protein
MADLDWFKAINPVAAVSVRWELSIIALVFLRVEFLNKTRRTDNEI